jgi:hypothetical protein
VQKAALGDTHSSQQQERQLEHHKQPKASQSKVPHQKNLTTSFSKSFISSGKQGGGAAVLWEGRDIATRETCFLLL